jgi:tetratricopeptide (TPR) repeat protein
MKRLLICILVCTCLSAALAQDVATLIRQGNECDDRHQPDQALRFYLPAENLDPKNAALLVRITRQYIRRMNGLGSNAQKLESARTALAYAERAKGLDPFNSDAHLSIAICLGRLAQLQGAREKVEAARRIKESAEKAASLDPNSDYAWHILGRWHQGMAGANSLLLGLAKIIYGDIPAASNEQALSYFQKAIALRPDRLIHTIELGRTYAQMGRREEARQWLEKGLAMPNRDFDDVETKLRARVALKKL